MEFVYMEHIQYTCIHVYICLHICIIYIVYIDTIYIVCIICTVIASGIFLHTYILFHFHIHAYLVIQIL